ncbi:SusC/RagA family TonB-linked outer membrane protein [Mongoliitalea lutea]|uniref:SusC/RagA family TonB-linked outer membrane protein n=1 Tax=Mongoliitalea lutea TaxID=849756 RepID=A0A8J3CTI3_9BACT|nr:TonB-dependent receptor [Mongoliitalea lutea]GHB27051.1 SusC/RagA family TonB-linked outer membrane protein [Mongoliitalea lutea]
MKKLFTLLLFLGLQLSLFAQTGSIRGQVLDERGDPIPGASILKVGTTAGTVTDLDGNFTLAVLPGDQLRVSFVGYETQTFTVRSQTEITIRLVEETSSLNEVIVVGYGTATKKELTGAVSQIKGEAVADMNMPRLDQALQGKLSGVTITTNSGAPGGTSNIRIRGLGTFGNNNPLILVDGVIFDAAGLNSLNPNDIESINVLKDATAGIYGVRAANGVIIVETKKGSKNQKPSLEFSSYYGVQQAERKLNLLNAREYAVLVNEAFAAGGNLPPFANTNLGVGTDWQSEVFQTAPIQEHMVTVNGGSEKTSYSIGGGYFGQQGIVGGDRSNFERYNARINFITEIAPKIKLTSVFLYSHERTSGIPQGGIGSVLFNTINAYPTEPVRVGNRFSFLENVQDIINPIAQIENTFNDAWVNKIVGKQELSYEINDHFSINGRAGYNFALVDVKAFSPLAWFGPGKFANSARNENLDPVLVDVGGTLIERGASVFEARDSFLDYNFEAFLNYDRSFDSDNRVKGTAGVSYFGNRNMGLNGTAFNIPNNDVRFADISASQAPGGFLNQTGSFQSMQKLVSAFVRGEYEYKGRYSVSGILRRDGSSNFGPNNRIGYFPTISGGWIISDEDFFSSKAIDFMKLRASFGVSGNDQIGLFRFRGLMNGLARYVFNDFIVNGAAIGTFSNPDLKWETTLQTNIGLDFTLFRDVDFTANYFIKDTRDLLFQPEVSALLGSYGPGSFPPFINAGNVTNRGIELEVAYATKRPSGVNFRVDYNFTYLRNRVTKVPEGLDFIPGAAFGVGGNIATRFQEGFPIGYFVGFKTDGIWQTQEEINSSPVVQPDARPGDLRFVDVNGDGVINFSDESDLTFLGSPIPDFIMGLNLSVDYKGFDFSANIYAALGQEIIRNYERQQPFANKMAYNVNRWTGPGTTNEIPRLTTGQTRNAVFSDFFVEDGSFARLRNVQIGYTLPDSMTGKVGIRSMRFYIAANNLFTLTRYMGFDPDVGSGNPLFAGVDNGIFPQARVIMGGLNFRF